jgi:large subunit ribosomal protein L2
MGKRIIAQRRGRGTSTYKNHNKGSSKTSYNVFEKDAIIRGEIVDIIHSKSHSAPLMKVKYENGREAFLPAYVGAYIGKEFVVDQQTTSHENPEVGNAYMIGALPEGTSVYNIELTPGDSSKLVKSGGSFAKIVSHNKGMTRVLLPSKKEKLLHSHCRAIVGEIGGGGRLEKPFLKAGLKAMYMAKTNKLYPKVSGVAMSAFDHPHGSTRSLRKGRPTIAPANAPPGRKVGMIRPRHTGRNK